MPGPIYIIPISPGRDSVDHGYIIVFMYIIYLFHMFKEGSPSAVLIFKGHYIDMKSQSKMLYETKLT